MNTDNKIKISVVDHKTIYDLEKSTDVLKKSYPFSYLQDYIIPTDSVDESDYIFFNSNWNICGEFNTLKDKDYYIKYKEKYIFYSLMDGPYCLSTIQHGLKFIAMPQFDWKTNIENKIIMTPLVLEDISYKETDRIEQLKNVNKKYEYSFIGGIWKNCREFLHTFEHRDDSNIINTENAKSIFKVSVWKHWKINKMQKQYFENLALSKFGFCPVGGGLNSYRLGECMRIGVIPIIVGHKCYPFEDEINYSEFSLMFENQKDVTHENIQIKMKNKNIDLMRTRCIEIWQKYYDFKEQAKYIYNKYLIK